MLKEDRKVEEQEATAAQQQKEIKPSLQGSRSKHCKSRR